MKKRILYIRQRIQRNILLVILFVAITIALFVKLISINNTDTKEREQLVNHTYRISKYIDNTQRLLAESESATRAFIATRDHRWTTNILSTHTQINNQLVDVTRLAIDPTQRKRVSDLQTLISTQLKLQTSITQNDSTLAGQITSFDGQDRKNMQAIQSNLSLFKDRQQVLLDQRSQAAALARKRALATVIIGSAVVFIFITGILLRLNSDIRRRKQAEEDIRQSEKKYRLLIEDSGVTIFTCDLGGVFTYVSGRAHALTGYSVDELMGKSFATLVAPEWIEVVADEYKEQLRQLWEETTIEFLINTASGGRKWVEQHAVLIYDEHYSPIGYQCMVRDITDKKEAALRAKKTENELQVMLNSTREGFFMINTNYEIILVNKQARTGIEAVSGKKVNEGMSILHFALDSERDTAIANFERVFAGHQVEQESSYITPGGQRQWIRFSHSPVRDENGVVTGAAVVSHDITEKRNQEQQIQAMLESTNEGFYMVDPNCRVQLINDAGFQNLKTVTGKECHLGDNFMDFILPERQNIFRRIFDNVLQGQTEENEAKLNTPEGTMWFRNTYFPIRDEMGDVTAVCMSSKDITERMLTEQAIDRIRSEREEYQFRLQSILDNTPLIIFVKDLEGKYLIVNKSFREVVDLDDTRIIGKTDFEFDDPIEADRYHKADKEVIRTLRSVESEETVMHGDAKRHLLLVKFPLFDKTGTIYGVGCIGTDYTDKVEYRQKLIEAKKKAESAEQLQEEFLANMSHEIRTPMNGIIGMTNILSGTTLDGEQRDLVDIIRQSSDTLLYLINDILDFSKIKSGKLSLEHIPFNVHEVVEHTIAPFYPKAAEKQIALTLSREGNIPAHLEGDPHRLNQILNNLLSNALKFTDAGKVSVSVRALAEENDHIDLEFTVSDTGLGIPEDKLTNIFNSFEQASSNTARKYGGTGLGLAITKKLVEMQGGEIAVNSQPGTGSAFRFVIRYQKTNESTISAKTIATNGSFDFTGKRILVAEDNEINQKVIFATLSKKGIDVTIANNGKEAVDMLEEGKTFDAIILDMQMPVMDGFQTATYIRRKLAIGTPIVAMTASALRNEKMKCFELGMNEYLAKPFSPDELFARLRKLIFDRHAPHPIIAKEIKDGGNGLYNLSHLYEMQDEEYFCEILELFLTGTPAALDDIKESVLYENWDQVYKKAHRMKSSLGILQMNHMLERVSRIELFAKEEKETTKIEGELKMLAEEFGLIRPMIEAELKSAS